jgi:hypothetical protein
MAKPVPPPWSKCADARAGTIPKFLSAPGHLPALAHAAPLKPSMAITFSQLRVGHILRADVETRDRILIVVTGNRITPALMERLRNFATLSGIREPLFVEP